VLGVVRDYINLRYRLMPYLYSSFHDSAASGEPVMRSLAIDYTHDARIYEPAFQNQYLFGSAFLVAPFDSTKEFGKIYFPAGQWYDLYTDRLQNGAQEQVSELTVQRLPVFVKAGSVVPVQSLVQSTAEKPDGTLALHIYKGDGSTSSMYYEDDGASFGYEKGVYYKRALGYDGAARKITLGAVEGSFKSKFSKLQIVLHGFGAQPSLSVNQKAVATSSASAGFFGAAADQVKVSSAVIPNDSGSITISY
jgi:alpha-glucosidase